MKFQGKIINWNDGKGYGFVEPIGGGNRAFVHIKSFSNRSRRPINGDLIIYEQVNEKNGKYKAINIGLIGDKSTYKKPHNNSPTFGMFFLLAFCTFVAILLFLELLPVEIIYLYVIVSMATFVIYAGDKSAAQNNRRRTPEVNLHLLSLIGGWPGAFLAQNYLRHKSSKREFQQVYWITVVINLCAFIWLQSEKGRQLIETIISQF